MSSFSITSRRVLIDSALAPATLVIHDGRIAAIERSPSPIGTENVGDLVLMPGLVDTHVHINEPGRTEWEGFASATRAAAAGGATTLVDMPLNSDPVTTTLAALEQKINASRGQLHVDVGFWGGVVPGNAAELAPMAAAGALGFKCFLCHSGIDDFPASTAADLRSAMPVLRKAGVPLLVHAELESALLDVPIHADPRAYSTYLHSRPRESEDRAVAMVVDLVRQTGCRAHIVHLSSASSLPILERAKAEGLPITAETCPHYLCLVSGEIPDGATQFKCSPPIREADNREALWRGLKAGIIDFVVTDHSPCIPALKRFDPGSFTEAWGGIASLQLGLRSVWTEARTRGISTAQLSRWMSAQPAALAGFSDRGGFRVGARADLLVWEPEHESMVDPRTLLHRHPITPYAGRCLAGRVDQVFLAGERIVLHGEPCGTPRGRPIVPSPGPE